MARESDISIISVNNKELKRFEQCLTTGEPFHISVSVNDERNALRYTINPEFVVYMKSYRDLDE